MIEYTGTIGRPTDMSTRARIQNATRIAAFCAAGMSCRMEAVGSVFERSEKWIGEELGSFARLRMTDPKEKRRAFGSALGSLAER